MHVAAFMQIRGAEGGEKSRRGEGSDQGRQDLTAASGPPGEEGVFVPSTVSKLDIWRKIERSVFIVCGEPIPTSGGKWWASALTVHF